MVIDILSSVVPTPEAFGVAEATLARLRGYQQHFTSGAKVPLVGDGSELQAAIESSDARGRAACPTQAQFDGMLDDAGVFTAVVYTEYYETSLGVRTVSNDVVADYVARDPGLLLGLAGVDPWKDDAVSETQRALTELGLRGIVLSPFKQRLDPSDARMARVFSVCEELGAPVFLHTGINWWVDTTYEIGHPRHIDALASSFPNLKIVALHCGWPWVEDMMMVAWPARQRLSRYLRAPAEAHDDSGLRLEPVAVLGKPDAVRPGRVRFNLDLDRDDHQGSGGRSPQPAAQGRGDRALAARQRRAPSGTVVTQVPAAHRK